MFGWSHPKTGFDQSEHALYTFHFYTPTRPTCGPFPLNTIWPGVKDGLPDGGQRPTVVVKDSDRIAVLQRDTHCRKPRGDWGQGKGGIVPHCGPRSKRWMKIES